MTAFVTISCPAKQGGVCYNKLSCKARQRLFSVCSGQAQNEKAQSKITLKVRPQDRRQPVVVIVSGSNQVSGGFDFIFGI